MGQLSIANVIDVSVATPQTGLGNYNTSNVGLFSDEPYDAETFGDAGYKIYLSPDDVATDFGTASVTYQQSLALFSQQPNILLGGGYLVIMPFNEAIQSLALSGVPASGSFTLNYGAAGTTAAINWNDTASAIQVKVRALTGFSDAVVTGTLASESIQIDLQGVYGPVSLPTVGGSGLQTSVPAAITITASATQVGETLTAAINRTLGLVQYFGVMGSLVFPQTDMLAAAAVIQTLNKVAFFASFEAADVAPGGMLDLLTTGGFSQSRGLFYDDVALSALQFMAAYVGLGLSTNFSGSNTTQTMHLKSLSGIQPDPNITQTILNDAQTAGADCYISIQGVPKVFISGANQFFDNVYNLQWFAGAIQVAGFNALAQTNTKIPQTENGMDIFKGALRAVCEQAITNQFLAPGSWTSPTTFGNQADLLLNVLQRGYYIYSVPISQQSPADRADRKAPLTQIAIKYAGAIQSADVIVNVNP